MKTSYECLVEENIITITGAVPLSDLNDLVYFFESRLGENCVVAKHPQNVDGFCVFRKDMEATVENNLTS